MTRATKKIHMNKPFLIFIVIVSVFLLSGFIDPSPRFTVITVMPPNDFDVILIANGEIEIPGHKSRAAWETYSYFYFWNYIDFNEIENAVLTLKVNARGETFEINIDPTIYKIEYGAVTLDLKTGSIVQGTTLRRAIFLNILRISLCLAVAGVIFYSFGYRKRRSWIAFAVISLPIEIVISLLMNGMSFIDAAEAFISLFSIVFGVPLLILKLTAMCIAINEHRRTRTLLYVLAATAAIVTLYIVLFTFLPF